MITLSDKSVVINMKRTRLTCT